MTTVVNTPSSGEKSGNGMSMLVGLALVIAVIFCLFYFGLPILRQATTQTAPQVNIPDQIDVNVNTPQQ